MFKIAISTYVDNESLVIPNLIKQLIEDAPISPKDVYVFSGGHATQFHEIRYGVNYYACDHNSYDHTALIGILDNNLDSHWWFMLHDTCSPGPRFAHKLSDFGRRDSHVAMLEEGWLNMGQFSPAFLSQCRNYILSLRNCTKMQAVLSEKLYSRFSNGEFYCKSGHFKSLGYQDVYGDGSPRMVIHFPALDLYKYQAYHHNSELMQKLKMKNIA